MTAEAPAPLCRLLTRQEAADILHMSETWIKRQIRAGQLGSVSLGRAVRVEEDELRRFIQSRKTAVVETVGTPTGSEEGGTDQPSLQVTERIVTAR